VPKEKRKNKLSEFLFLIAFCLIGIGAALGKSFGTGTYITACIAAFIILLIAGIFDR
jgi:uncharacterized membrane protein YjjP (DUF1212 family)